MQRYVFRMSGISIYNLLFVVQNCYRRLRINAVAHRICDTRGSAVLLYMCFVPFFLVLYMESNDKMPLKQFESLSY